MARADVADQHCLFLHAMPILAIGLASVNGVLVVDALTDGVALDKLEAHGGTD
jgi:hypothetical protein